MEDEAPVFRASKRRKVAQKEEKSRSRSPSGDEGAPSLIKARTRSRARHVGVQFTNAKSTIREDDNVEPTALALASESGDASVPGGLASRFVGSGASSNRVNDDKHMTNYIVRAMAERHGHANMPTHARPAQDDDVEYTDASSDDEAPSRATQAPSTHTDNHTQEGRPCHHQHLTEVTIAPTAPAVPTTNAPRPRRRKPRLGHDGKPLRMRPRRGPNAEDIARGQLVEQVLHEHGLGTYDAASASGVADTGANAGTNEAADERMAAEFQAQFMDAMAERMERQGAKKEGGGNLAVGTGQGPRLGGSRTARARMAALQAQSQQAPTGGGRSGGAKRG